MPLSEFYRMAKSKLESSQQRTATTSTDLNFLPDNEFVELVWENGQIMMQSQSSRVRSPNSDNFPPHTTKFRDKDIGNATTTKIGKFGTVEPSFNDFPLSVPSVEMGLDQDDDMVPWLNYPIEDTQDYFSELLPEASGSTLKESSTHNSFAIDKSSCSNQMFRNPHSISVHNGMSLEQGNASKVSSSRTGQLYPWSSQQGQTSVPSQASGVSDIISNNTGSIHHAVCGVSVQGQTSAGGSPIIKMQKKDSGLPRSNSSLLNFFHFSRPAAIVRANLQNIGAVATTGSSGVERTEIKDKKCAKSASNAAKSTVIDSNNGSQKEMGLTKVDSKPVPAKPPEETPTAEQSDFICQKDVIRNDKSTSQIIGTTTGVPDGEKIVEPVVASSSVCSGNSPERASNDLTNSMKRKFCDAEESECRSEDIAEESVKRTAPARGRIGSKRSRAAEVHNLSERRRRDRINEKMRALQELIPNCNKVDKASMLDEAIEYLKTLQLQVQIMSMGSGMYMPPMMFPTGMQHIQMPHFSHMGFPMGMGMGMGFGMSMVDTNGGSSGCPMIPVPPMQGAHFPSPPISGSNFQVYGHPSPGFPMSVPRPLFMPMPGGPPMNSAIGLNASRMGVHVQVPGAAPTLNSEGLIWNANSQPMHDVGASSSMNPKRSQHQATNEGFNQSTLVQKKDQAPDVSSSAAVNSTNANNIVPSKTAGTTDAQN